MSQARKKKPSDPTRKTKAASQAASQAAYKAAILAVKRFGEEMERRFFPSDARRLGR